tara:strand:+ start:634 stop:765 length:132 start_codon:yes stop_codon:yes gene_type:complete
MQSSVIGIVALLLEVENENSNASLILKKKFRKLIFPKNFITGR